MTRAWYLLGFLVFILVASGTPLPPASAQTTPPVSYQVWLPQISRAPGESRFGAQILDFPAITPALAQATSELGIGWARVAILSWDDVEHNEGAPYKWEALAGFEATVRALRAANVRVEVVVGDSPKWATINDPYITSCGAIRPDKFANFGKFMVALVNRYAQPEFGVYDWELGNEVDVDPKLVGANSGFGCWGDVSDQYYGGERYGKMLKAVTPLMRATGRPIRVWHGGLLLGSPQSERRYGVPEAFLRGVLVAGGGPYFDLLPVHVYPNYIGAERDPTDQVGGPWSPYGGPMRGKINYVRSLMSQYGVSKPIVINEFAVVCPSGQPAFCPPGDPNFYETQASLLVRDAVRGLSADVEAVYWYKIGQPDWRGTSLLQPDATRTASFASFRHLIQRLGESTPLGSVQRGTGIEAHAFNVAGRRVEVVWTQTRQQQTVALSRGSVELAYTRDGRPLRRVTAGNEERFIVGFAPIYLMFK